MKKLSDVFELPVSGQDVSEFYYLDCSDEEDDDAIAHAINHVDALADALEVMIQHNWHAAHHRKEAQKVAEQALKAYRGEA
jgi:hypothetical protein